VYEHRLKRLEVEVCKLCFQVDFDQICRYLHLVEETTEEGRSPELDVVVTIRADVGNETHIVATHA